MKRVRLRGSKVGIQPGDVIIRVPPPSTTSLTAITTFMVIISAQTPCCFHSITISVPMCPQHWCWFPSIVKCPLVVVLVSLWSPASLVLTFDFDRTLLYRIIQNQRMVIPTHWLTFFIHSKREMWLNRLKTRLCQLDKEKAKMKLPLIINFPN